LFVAVRFFAFVIVVFVPLACFRLLAFLIRRRSPSVSVSIPFFIDRPRFFLGVHFFFGQEFETEEGQRDTRVIWVDGQQKLITCGFGECLSFYPQVKKMASSLKVKMAEAEASDFFPIVFCMGNPIPSYFLSLVRKTLKRFTKKKTSLASPA